MSIISIKEVVNKTLIAIKESHELYYKWSDGEWLWSAPEYLLTVKIAEKIASSKNSQLITMEDNVKFILKNANALGKGKIDNKVRPDGRFDIVLWYNEDIPRAVIEVKNSVNRYEKIQKDLLRIKKVLNRKKSLSKLEFGLISFYICNQYKSNAKESIEIDINKIFKDAKNDIVENDELKITQYLSEIFCQDDKNAYCAVVFLIENIGSKL